MPGNPHPVHELATDAWKELHDMQNVPVYLHFRWHYESMFRDEERGIQSEVEDSHLIKDPRVLKYALHVAITTGQEDIARFLYGEVISLRELLREELSRDDYFILLEKCIAKKMFQIAWNLLHHFRASWATDEHMAIILTLAETPPPFFFKSQLKFVRLWIYHCIQVNVEAIKPGEPVNVWFEITEEEPSCYQSCLQFLKALPRKSVITLSKILGKQPRLRKINS